MRYMPSLPHRQPADTIRSLEAELRSGARYWALIPSGEHLPRVPETVIGFVGFLGGTRLPGMGYFLRREFWQRGLITEALLAAIGYGFEELGLDRVELWINEANTASRRVAEKLGFRPKGRIHQRYSHESAHHIMLAYGLRAAEWPATAKQAAVTRPQVIGLQPVLAVPDVGKTAAFYRDVLAFEIDFLFGDPPSHAGVSLGDWSAESILIQFTQSPPDTPAAFNGWLYIMVESEIDSLFQLMKDNGADIMRPPATYPWGMREFSLRDLNGVELRFGTHSSEQAPE
jgi:RimJ/RimL family protein N-acetyltransferase/uncharacterized glyoxalase superfamily protein PhnB